nr:hypothetical protein GCM10017745_44340 [Saccharothrix mutabilis subsp. capreolus]
MQDRLAPALGVGDQGFGVLDRALRAEQGARPQRAQPRAVQVGVVDAGHDRPAAQVHHAGVRADQVGDVADRDHAPAGDGQRVGLAVAGVEGQHRAPGEHQVGGWGCRHGVLRQRM